MSNSGRSRWKLAKQTVLIELELTMYNIHSQKNHNIAYPLIRSSDQSSAFTQNPVHLEEEAEGDIQQLTPSLMNDTPIYQCTCRFPHQIAEEIERQCHEINSLDTIEP